MALAGKFRAIQLLRISKFSKVSLNFLTERSIKNVASSFSCNVHQNRYFCTDEKPKKIPPRSAKQSSTSEQGVPKRKPLVSPLITLISPENDVSSMTLENAQKLANRRNLKIVKILDYDTKTERPLYKLMTALEYFDEGAKAKERKKKAKNSSLKEEKLFTISTKISEHDLLSKLRQMEKLLKKKHEVKVYISVDGNPAKADEVANTIETELSELISSKKRVSTNFTLKLFIAPKLEEVKSDSPVSEQNEKESDKEAVKESDKKMKETQKKAKETDKKPKETSDKKVKAKVKE